MKRHDILHTIKFRPYCSFTIFNHVAIEKMKKDYIELNTGKQYSLKTGRNLKGFDYIVELMIDEKENIRNGLWRKIRDAVEIEDVETIETLLTELKNL